MVGSVHPVPTAIARASNNFEAIITTEENQVLGSVEYLQIVETEEVDKCFQVSDVDDVVFKESTVG